MIRILVMVAGLLALSCVAEQPPKQTVITIHVPREQAQRALDEGELIMLMTEDFKNMDEKRGMVDLALRKHMDVVMKRLMTKNMWVEP